MNAEPGYVFDQTRQGERERLATIEAYLDRHSQASLEALGVGPGWRCLDVGAGGGSLTAWLCRRVGAEGTVTAVDIDTRFLEELNEPNLEVRPLDILRDELPRECFDLVHARYLLEHLPDRETALHQLVRAARPGGLLVLTDSGGVPPSPVEPSELFERVGLAFMEAVAPRGWDFGWAPTMAERLRQLGLAEVGAEAFRRYESTPGVGARGIMAESFVVLREAILATGQVTAEEVDAATAMLRDPKCGMLGFETWTAWGRRPT